VSTVRTTYQDPLSGEATITSQALLSGGTTLNQDLGKLLASPGAASAIGEASTAFWGRPPRALSMTWFDMTPGIQSDLPPVWWADYSTGDQVTFEGSTWKVLVIQSGLETREATAEIQEIPS